MTYLAFVRKERRLLSFAVSFTFFSSFGQTFLISLFVPYFLTAFELSNATFGSLYSVATLTSAVALPWLGQWIDRIPLRQYSMYVAIGLLIASLVMAVSWHISMLFVGLILLRLAGQGLSGHTAQTTMARYNDQLRGKALSISGIGYPLGEAVLPSIIAGMLVLFHWRTTWAIIAFVIAVFFIPVLWFLIRRERTAVDEEIIDEEKPSASEQYKLLAKDVRTWYVVPAILNPLLGHRFISVPGFCSRPIGMVSRTYRFGICCFCCNKNCNGTVFRSYYRPVLGKNDFSFSVNSNDYRFGHRFPFLRWMGCICISRSHWSHDGFFEHN